MRWTPHKILYNKLNVAIYQQDYIDLKICPFTNYQGTSSASEIKEPIYLYRDYKKSNMAVSKSRGIGDTHQQFRSLQAIVNHIRSQEMFLQVLDREDAIPDMAKRLSREAITGELKSNKRLFLDFFYNMIAMSGETDRIQDVEFKYVVIGQDLMEVDRCLLWYDDLELLMPFEIGEKFGKVVLGEQMGNVVDTITDFYKKAEARFDRELDGNLERCSLLVLEEHYPQSAFHITVRLPATILNDYPISL